MVDMTEKTWTTVKIQKESLEKLKSIGKKGETYDDILDKLIQRYKGALDDT